MKRRALLLMLAAAALTAIAQVPPSVVATISPVVA